jgi:hypothetical protein
MMPVDRYTKAVLTVIAACLLWLSAITSGWPVQAQQRPPELTQGPAQPVVIVGWGTMDGQGRIELSQTSTRAGSRTDPNLPVRVIDLPPGPIDVRLPYSESWPLPVGVAQVKPAGVWEPMRVSVEDAPVRLQPGRGK